VVDAIVQAGQVRDALRSAGFEVTEIADADLSVLSQRIETFADSLQAGDVAAFGYFGHGLQEDGENYLAPVKYSPDTEQRIFQRAYSLSRVIDMFEDRRAYLKMFFID